jgi:hypothetical protein
MIDLEKQVCLTKWRGSKCCISGTDHFSRASGSTVWFVYPNVFETTTFCQSQGILSICTALTVPRIVPLQTLNIDEDPQKLGNGKSRVSVVELDGDRVGELLPGLLALLEATDNVVERGSAPEVLLLQAELLTAFEAGKG